MHDQPIDNEVQARAILGLAPDAPLAAWRPAFACALRASHPDMGGDADDARRVIEAYNFLKRVETARHAGAAAAARRNTLLETGRALTVEISLREAFLGCERVIDWGTGTSVTVRLPGGLKSGQCIALPGQSERKLYIRVRSEAIVNQV